MSATDNQCFQLQGINRLYLKISSRKTSITGPIKGNHQVKELILLLDDCHQGCTAVALASGSALLQLVKEDVIDADFLLNDLLALWPSARNLHGIVYAISGLLQYQIIQLDDSKQPTATNYFSKYSLRAPPHPFISLLNGRPECWTLLLDEVQKILLHENSKIRNSAVHALRAFFKYVLIHPNPSKSWQPLIRELHYCLLYAHVTAGMTNCNSASHTYNFLLDVIPWMQVDSIEEAKSVSLLLQHFCTVLVMSKSLHTSRFCSRLVCRVIMHVFSVSFHDMDTSFLLHACAQLTEVSSIEFSYAEQILIVAARLMRTIPVTALCSLLEIIRNIYVIQRASVIKLCSAMLLTQLQQILVLVNTVIDHNVQHVSKVAKELLVLTEQTIFQQPQAELQMTGKVVHERSAGKVPGTFQAFTSLLKQLEFNRKGRNEWLLRISSTKPSAETVLIVNAILLLGFEKDTTESALKAATLLAKIYPDEAICSFWVLMYKLNLVTDAELKHKILNALPHFATHQLCVTPILKTFQALLVHPKLKATAVQLLSELCALQERCFPHLSKILLENEETGDGKDMIDELLVSKMLAVRRISQERPFQHGPALMPVISQVLTNCTDDAGTIPSVLALETLYALCEAEVVDLRTVWTVLAKRLESDKRPLIAEQTCRLLSLVPSLSLQTAQYEAFTELVVERLWKVALTASDSRVQGKTWLALSEFSSTYFTQKHLPPEIKKKVKIPSRYIDDPEAADSLPIPGYCYLQLAQFTQKYSEYGIFLKGLLNTEIENLPRTVYHVTGLRTMPVAQNKTIANIPEFLFNKYERSKMPGIQGGLALGVLQTFDPPLFMDKDGKIRRIHVFNKSRQFNSIVLSLLRDVPVQCAEWFSAPLLPSSWMLFIERMYHSSVEGRKAEVEIKVKKNEYTPEQAEEETKIAWLSVRDHIANTLKTASRGSPLEQGNSIFALASLASIVLQYVIDMSKTQEVPKKDQVGQSKTWLRIVTETILNIADENYEPLNQILNWLQNKAGKVGFLARCGAIMSFEILVPHLITDDTEYIRSMLKCLLSHLPDGSSGESNSVTFCAGLSLGSLLSVLYNEKFLDFCSATMKACLMEAQGHLENCCLNGDFENRSGCVLGLMSCLTAICQEGSISSINHVTEVLQNLLDALKNTNPMSMDFPALALCVSVVTSVAFKANSLQQETCASTMEVLLKLQNENPQDAVLSQALGIIVNTLSITKQQDVIQMKENLSQHWMKLVTSQDSTMLSRLTALRGTLALFGADAKFTQFQDDTQAAFDTRLNDIVKLCIQLLSTNTDSSLLSSAAWMLGKVHTAASSHKSRRDALPLDYSYLGDQSMLNGLLNIISEAGKIGPERLNKDELLMYLRVLADKHTKCLPPLNWSAVLTPLVKQPFGDLVQRCCLEIASNECRTSPAALSFVVAWSIPPLLHTLQPESKVVVRQRLSGLAQVLPTGKLSLFLQHSVNDLFMGSLATQSGKHIKQVEFVKGLIEVLQLVDLPETLVSILHTTVQDIYNLLPDDIKGELLENLCTALSYLTDSQVANLVHFANASLDSKHLYSISYLVSHGHRPLSWLDKCIEITLRLSDDEQSCERLMHAIYICLQASIGSKSQHFGEMKKLEWLLNLMAKIKEILKQNTHNLNSHLSILMQVLAIAISVWAGKFYHPAVIVTGLENNKMFGVDAVQMRLDLLPTSLPVLLDHQPWTQVTEPVIGWLQLMKKENVTSYVYHVGRTCLQQLRNTQVFKTVPVWTIVALSV